MPNLSANLRILIYFTAVWFTIQNRRLSCLYVEVPCD